MNFSIKIIGIAVGLLLSATLRAEKISISLSAKPLGLVVGELGKATGRPLACSGSLASTVMVVKVKEVEAAEVMERLAKVVSAKWIEEGDRIVLKVDPVSVRRRDQKASAERLRTIAAQLDFAKQRLAAMAPFDAREAQKALAQQVRRIEDPSLEISLNDPAGRALLECVAALDPKFVASLPLGRATMLGSRPTAMERPLGAAGARAVETFCRLQDVWHRSVALKIAALPPSDQARGMEERAQPIDDPKSVRLLVKFHPAGPGGQFEGFFVKRNGVVLNTASVGISGPDETPVRSPLPVDPQLSVRLPDALRSRARLLYPHGPEAQGEAERRVLPSWVKDPVATEPLSLVAAPMVEAFADKLERDLIAVLPDSTFRLAMLVADRQEEVNVSEALDALPVFGAAVDLDERFLCLTDLGQPRESRPALRSFVQDLARPADLPPGSVMRFVAASGVAGLTEIDRAYFRLLRPGFEEAMGRCDWDLLGFVGSLTPTTMADVRAGRAVKLTHLPGKAAEFLDRIVFATTRPVNLRVDPAAGKTNVNAEPTQALPEGIPSQAFVTGLGRGARLLAWIEQDGERTALPVDPAGAELLVEQLQRRSGATSAPYTPRLVGFTEGAIESFRLRFQLSSNVSIVRDLMVPTGTPIKIVGYEDLRDRGG